MVDSRTLVRLCALFAYQLLDPITGFVHNFFSCETIGATGILVSLRNHKSVSERATGNVL